MKLLQARKRGRLPVVSHIIVLLPQCLVVVYTQPFFLDGEGMAEDHEKPQKPGNPQRRRLEVINRRVAKGMCGMKTSLQDRKEQDDKCL